MKKKNTKKILISIIALIIVVCVGFVSVSHGVYHRSIMATFSEMAMVLIDRERIYRPGDGYEDNIEFRRTENLKDISVPDSVKLDVSLRENREYGMQTFYFNEESFNGTLIMYLTGGAYLNNPLTFHWKIINNVAKETNNMVVMPNYLKSPNYTCDESYKALEAFFHNLCGREGVERIILMGDSAGGGMCLVLAQLMRDDFPKDLAPEEIILIAPWMDVSMDNEMTKEIDPYDPMLDRDGAIALGKLWAGDRDVHDPKVSPIYGNFRDLGRITMFAGDRDMLYADTVKFSEILTEQGVDHILVTEEGLNHPYPLFPIPEAKKAQQIMFDIINGTYEV